MKSFDSNGLFLFFKFEFIHKFTFDVCLSVQMTLWFYFHEFKCVENEEKLFVYYAHTFFHIPACELSEKFFCVCQTIIQNSRKWIQMSVRFFFFAFLIIFRNDWKTRYWSWIILNCWLLWKRFNSADVYVNQSFTQSVIKTAIKEKIERTPHIDISHGAHETHSYILISVLFPFNWYFSINSYQNEPLSDGDGKNTKIK